MSCSDHSLVSLLLQLHSAGSVAAVVGASLAAKLQPWLLSAARCEQMLRGEISDGISHADVIVVKRALCR